MKALHGLLLSAVLCSACATTTEPARSTSSSTTPSSVAASQEESPAGMPQPVEPLEAHAWLGQLVGEWDVTALATMSPDAEPVRFESRTSGRWLGSLWVLLEGGSDEYESLMTLGIDEGRGGYTGTWIDSMMPTLWVYSGRIEEDGRALVLEAEGPHHMDPTRRAQYRDTFRVVSADRLSLTSSMKADDGAWNDFMTADYRRRK